MIIRVTECIFIERFEKSYYKDNFSNEALRELFDYLTSSECDGYQIELDVVAISCEFTEYSTLENFQKDYGEEYESIEDIENKTQVIRLYSGGFIIQNF